MYIINIIKFLHYVSIEFNLEDFMWCCVKCWRNLLGQHLSVFSLDRFVPSREGSWRLDILDRINRDKKKKKEKYQDGNPVSTEYLFPMVFKYPPKGYFFQHGGRTQKTFLFFLSWYEDQNDLEEEATCLFPAI